MLGRASQLRILSTEDTGCGTVQVMTFIRVVEGYEGGRGEEDINGRSEGEKEGEEVLVLVFGVWVWGRICGEGRVS